MKGTAEATRDFLSLKEELVNKAWTDDVFRARLITYPNEVLRSHGANIPDGVDVEVIEDDAAKWHFVLPAAPLEGEVSDADLIGANGGTTLNCISVPTTFTLPPSITFPRP